jgi:hypothetical protein
VIIFDRLQFPANAIGVLVDHLILVDDPVPSPQPDEWFPLQIFRRPLRANDGYQAIGVFPDNWQPDDDSYEMIGGPSGRHMPSIQRYYIGVHAMVKDTDEELGQANHAELAERVRNMLYTDTDLHLALASLSVVTHSGKTVRAKRWGVESQKYLSNEFSGSWIYLANIRFYLEVETT